MKILYYTERKISDVSFRAPSNVLYMSDWLTFLSSFPEATNPQIPTTPAFFSHVEGLLQVALEHVAIARKAKAERNGEAIGRKVDQWKLSLSR